MPTPADHAVEVSAAAPIFAALGDPLRLAIVARLCREGPLPTIALRGEASAVSRQGITKHLQILEQAGLLSSDRVGRDRQWRLQARQITAVRDYLGWMSAKWDGRLERLRAFVEDGD